MSLWKPSVQDILRLHVKLVSRTGGVEGVRSLPLIESALQRFEASFEEKDMYKTLFEKTAAVCCGLIQNHGFVDGNKRVGVETMRLILVMNDCTIRYTQAELVALGLSIAQGIMDVPDVTAWIQNHSA